MIYSMIVKVKAIGERKNLSNPLRPDIPADVLDGSGYNANYRYENNDKDCIMTIWCSDLNALQPQDRKTGGQLTAFVASKFGGETILQSHPKSKTGKIWDAVGKVVLDE